EIRPVAAHYDETEDFPWPVLSKAADIGLYGMDFYRMIGEGETGSRQPLLVEELCWGCAGISLGIFGSGLPLVALIASGTPAQVRRWTAEVFGPPPRPGWPRSRPPSRAPGPTSPASAPEPSATATTGS